MGPSPGRLPEKADKAAGQMQLQIGEGSNWQTREMAVAMAERCAKTAERANATASVAAEMLVQPSILEGRAYKEKRANEDGGQQDMEAEVEWVQVEDDEGPLEEGDGDGSLSTSDDEHPEGETRAIGGKGPKPKPVD